ncbi:MAG: cell division protein FtsL [Proteobacteria bacterium]|nr:cell division protein FtsL [Pseudomonadota bacterium]
MLKPRYKYLSRLSLLVFFVASVFSLIAKREDIRIHEKEKKHLREVGIRLNDEWRTLQLEYATLTGYHEVHAQATQLKMMQPQQHSFFYLMEEDK